MAPALRTSFHDYEVATCGFSCQGPVLLQMLNLLEGYDLAALGHNSPRALHVMVEAMKLAFADREAYYGDPKHVKVPADGLLSKVYAKARRALIHEDRAWPDMPPPGDPYGLAAVQNGAPTDAARAGRDQRRARHLVRLRGGRGRQRLLVHAQRSLRGLPAGSRAWAAWCRRAARRAGSRRGIPARSRPASARA